ncbi:MAG: stage 0 sporulation family protein [Lachnospiraceae bacterium]|nr:stage 0 sporulation family protein [Lachnospiraceae bacterium]
MVKVICVRFRTAGKVYYFDPLSFEIKKGDNVIVETARGIEFGTVVSGVREVEESEVVAPLKPVLRIATEKDKEQEKTNREKEREAFKVCLEKIRKHELEMKLIDAEYTFDNNKILFYFTADGRIDFRELVKDLAAVFKTRIELRQIGVRDETKIIGGYGICGRPLCCHSYLSDFAPVSIRMAKEQNLSLNPTKISGVCGRLMCCLKNEEETYEELNRNLPGLGDIVTVSDGTEGEVSSVNVLRQLVKVLVEVNDEKELREYKAEEIVSTRKKNKGKKKESAEEAREMQELEKLERMDRSDRDEKDEKPGRGGNKPRNNQGKGSRQGGNGQTGRNNGGQDNNDQNGNGQNNRNNGGQGSRNNQGGNGQNNSRPQNNNGENGGEEGKSKRRNRGHNRGNRPKKTEGNKAPENSGNQE